MKLRVLMIFLLFSLLLAGCDSDGKTTDPFNQIPPTFTPAPPTATAEPKLTADTSSLPKLSTMLGKISSACESLPLYLWPNPGIYSYFLSSGTERVISQRGGAEDNTARHQRRLLGNQYYDCGILINWYGEILPEPPATNISLSFSDECKVDDRQVTQSTVITIVGWEKINTLLGDLTALRIDSESKGELAWGNDKLEPFSVSTSEWYVCGLGNIYTTSSHNGDLFTFELFSFTPLTTNEARVRIILADITFGYGDNYRTNITSKEVAEALRRADAGITVTNLDQFERKLINQEWTITNAGTEIPANGMDIRLSSDPP